MNQDGKKGALPNTKLFVETKMDILRHIYKNGIRFMAYASKEDKMYNVSCFLYSININEIK